MSTKVIKINGKCQRTALIGKNLYVDFPNMTENPFGSELGDTLIVAVCGALKIRTNKCFPSFNADTGTATIMFHFTRPKWGERAKKRIEAMQVLFSKTSVREEDWLPPTAKQLAI